MVRSLLIAVCAGLIACCLAQSASEYGCNGCIEGRCTKVRGGKVVRCTACMAGHALTRLDDNVSRVCVPDEEGEDDDEKPGACPAVVPGSFGCEETCEEDDDCDGADKCCNTACGKTCVPPEGDSEPEDSDASGGDGTTGIPESETDTSADPLDAADTGSTAGIPESEMDIAADPLETADTGSTTDVGTPVVPPPAMEDISDAEAAADLPDTDDAPVPDTESPTVATVDTVDAVDTAAGSVLTTEAEEVPLPSIAPEAEDNTATALAADNTAMAPEDEITEEDEASNLLDLEDGM